MLCIPNIAGSKLHVNDTVMEVNSITDGVSICLFYNFILVKWSRLSSIIPRQLTVNSLLIPVQA